MVSKCLRTHACTARAREYRTLRPLAPGEEVKYRTYIGRHGARKTLLRKNLTLNGRFVVLSKEHRPSRTSTWSARPGQYP